MKLWREVYNQHDKLEFPEGLTAILSSADNSGLASDNEKYKVVHLRHITYLAHKSGNSLLEVSNVEKDRVLLL